MKDKIFIDTNLLVYLYGTGEKSIIIEKIINKYFYVITLSTQVLGELYNVLTRRKMTSKDEARKIVIGLIENFHVVNHNEFSVLSAIEINLKYGYSYWDSMIIVSAMENDCRYLYSEDMQNYQTINGKLTITNPYLLK